MTAQDLIEFESGVKDLWEAGKLPSLVHLCGGNEDLLVKLFEEIKPGDWVFSTHRTHYHALMAGIPAWQVLDKIKHGDSMFIYSKAHNFLCSAVLAGCCGIAAGVAWAIEDSINDEWVWCFIGDGGEEEGHFYEAAMFVEANDLPCTFIIEDNNRSVDTPRDARRGSAKGLEHLFKCVQRYHYTPTYPHAGSGCSFKIEFDKDAIENHKHPKCHHTPKCFEKSDFCWNYDEAKKRSDGLPNYP
jgi:Dehydrogenase E1 component